jgi:hypothetical protein
MTECLIQKSAVGDDDLEKIQQFARRELDSQELYVFNVTLCDNDIDRDFERFSLDALEQLAELFVGKTGICDHSMKSSDQKARIFDTWVEKQEGRLTSDGEQLYCLKAKAYMLNNDENKALIDEIDAGIKKEVSVSCSMAMSTCSVCGKNKRSERCSHIAGKTYDGKVCYSILSDARDAYEFSFVAVPAQREAGITKSFDIKEDIDMQDIIKSITCVENDITLSKSQAKELSSYIDDLREEAMLGEEYKKQLSKEVVGLFAKTFPNMDTKLFSSITAVMTTKELLGFRDGMKKSEKGAKPHAQLMSSEEKKNNDYSEFKI